MVFVALPELGSLATCLLGSLTRLLGSLASSFGRGSQLICHPPKMFGFGADVLLMRTQLLPEISFDLLQSPEILGGPARFLGDEALFFGGLPGNLGPNPAALSFDPHALGHLRPFLRSITRLVRW